MVVNEYEGVMISSMHGADERTGDVGPSCGSRVALASVHASQPSWRPWASAGGASAVMEGSARGRVEPACRRRCILRSVRGKASSFIILACGSMSPRSYPPHVEAAFAVERQCGPCAVGSGRRDDCECVTENAVG
eukprot:4995022-Pleurochrysis_carterae.AAC.2